MTTDEMAYDNDLCLSGLWRLEVSDLAAIVAGSWSGPPSGLQTANFSLSPHSDQEQRGMQALSRLLYGFPLCDLSSSKELSKVRCPDTITLRGRVSTQEI